MNFLPKLSSIEFFFQWTCVHDIQLQGTTPNETPFENKDELSADKDCPTPEPLNTSSSSRGGRFSQSSSSLNAETQRLVWQLIDIQDQTLLRQELSESSHSDDREESDSEQTNSPLLDDDDADDYNDDDDHSFISDDELLDAERSSRSSSLSADTSHGDDDFFNLNADSTYHFWCSSDRNVPVSGTESSVIKTMHPRLLFHSEEPNVGSGFIKEQSFSPDGRVLVSPFGKCARLLGFDSSCLELCDCIPDKAKSMEEVGLIGSMKSIVFASSFSPTHPIVAVGCKDGTISFCTPKL